MAYEESLRSVSFDSDSSLASYTGVPGVAGSAAPNWGKQFRFVKLTGAHQVGLATADTDAVIGVMQNKPQVSGQAATVAIHGISMMQSGAAITAGAGVTTDATGRAIAATGEALVYGFAIGSVSAADKLVPVLLRVS